MAILTIEVFLMIIFRLYLKPATNEVFLSNLPPQNFTCAEGEVDANERRPTSWQAQGTPKIAVML